jgi:N5-(carboxyethyl)ornithine synthase
MKTVGFLISTKENEKRRCLLPKHLKSIRNKGYLYFEKGYGEDFGFSDDQYLAEGVKIAEKSEIMAKDIVCDPKIGDCDCLSEFKPGQTIFGWVHATQNRDIADILIKHKLTAIAWEEMYEKGRAIFYRNNELAGEAAVMHAFTLYGKVPYDCNVALIGRGNTARGAYMILTSLGARVTVYNRKMEQLLRDEIGKYDVVVNGILWDTKREDHIIYKEDLIRMKKPALIIDVSCDRNGGIETSIPTTIENPVYKVDGVLHYVVDHTPSLLSYTATEVIGEQVIRYLDDLIEGKEEDNQVLKEAMVIKDGVILDQSIIEFQNR